MTEPQTATYERLMNHLARLGMGLPPRDTLLDLLHRMFTPEEAEIALHLPTEVTPLHVASPDEVAAGLEMPPDEVAGWLEDMAARGILYSGRTRDGGTGYGLLQTGFGFPQTFFWDGGQSPEAAEMAGLVSRYFNRHVTREAYSGSETKPYRYVPIETSLDEILESGGGTKSDGGTGPGLQALQAVLPAHAMEPILDGAERFALAHCPCRVAMDLRGGECSHPKDVCMKFDEMADYLIERGLGREISREEAREVIERSREAGLVHFVDNAQGGIKHNCNCCGCACWNVGNIRRRKIPRDALMATYFLRGTDEDECTGCGDCEDICPVAAAEVDEGGVARIDEEWCIGCGVCVPRCPAGAAYLYPRPDRSLEIPSDFSVLHERIIEEKKAGRADAGGSAGEAAAGAPEPSGGGGASVTTGASGAAGTPGTPGTSGPSGTG